MTSAVKTHTNHVFTFLNNYQNMIVRIWFRPVNK